MRFRNHVFTYAVVVILTALGLQAALKDAWPQFVPADQQTAITMVFTDAAALPKSEELTLQYVCADGLRADGRALGWAQFEKVPFELKDDTLTATVNFRGETEHTLRLVSPHATNGMKKPVVHGTFKLYSLKPDFFALRPYKGDVHMHSKFSDGRKDETPSHMIATCRKLGHDFAIATDHRSYAGSQEAMSTFAKLPTDMRCFPGEEVHSPGNGVHILSLGASAGITEWFTEKRPEYDQAVTAEKARIDAKELPEALHHPAAASVVVWNKIRELGGIAVYCHPYWRPDHRQYIPAALSDYLLQKGQFDAFEVLNGGSNDLGILHYHELRAQGRNYPGIGVTDAHASANLGKAYTLIMSESLSFSDLAANIRKGNCIAVEVDPATKQQRAHGNLRLGRFATFLFTHYYPQQHDKLCAEEGDLLVKAVAGDTAASDALKPLQGRVPALFDKYWAK
ncbi:MAG TPA: PHP-associated domain-containing protein [Lentisphaeria bacterium]|nr:PHP-associated domain-containing protein [Lentisphaeria bacterium]